MPKTLLKLSMAVAVIAVGLAGGELLLCLPPESTLAFLGPANATYRIRTDELDGLVVTNDLSFREPVSFGPKAPGTLRIVTIGDSYTFGWGVNYDETYGQAMRRALARDEGIGNVEIVNISRGGAGHTDYIMFARDYAFRLDPDLIVVGFLFGNNSVFGTSG